MLAAGRGDTRLALPAPVQVGRLAARESPELEAAEAAAALGGLGRLAGEIDEALVTALHELSRRRFQFLIEMPAVAALERMLADGEAVAAWWEALWAAATPVSFTHLRAPGTVLDLVCRLLLAKKKTHNTHITLSPFASQHYR